MLAAHRYVTRCKRLNVFGRHTPVPTAGEAEGEEGDTQGWTGIPERLLAVGGVNLPFWCVVGGKGDTSLFFPRFLISTLPDFQSLNTYKIIRIIINIILPAVLLLPPPPNNLPPPTRLTPGEKSSKAEIPQLLSKNSVFWQYGSFQNFLFGQNHQPNVKNVQSSEIILKRAFWAATCLS